MSGGIAYVFDEEGDFAQRCNLDMVDLEPITQPEEEALVKELIQRHAALTRSARARRILDDWQHFKEKLVKVMPLEYRRVLNESVTDAAAQAAPAVRHG
jgi:glutamate synthase domain-containing protein 3